MGGTRGLPQNLLNANTNHFVRPGPIERIVETSKMTFPIIDYSVHPAYAPLMARYIYDDELIGECVSRVDLIHSQFLRLLRPSLEDADQVLKDIKATLRRIGKHAIDVDAPILAREWLGTTLDWVQSELRYEYYRRSFCKDTSHERHLAADQLGQLETLKSNGMYVVELDKRLFDRICRLAHDFIPELQRRLEANRSGRAASGLSRLSPIGRAVHSAMSAARVFDVLNAYKQNRMRILGIGIEYSTAGQMWHSGIYSDVGLPDGPLRYLHVDESDHLPKAMIYATAVTKANGPTGIIQGSNRWDRSELRFRAYKGLDRVTLNRYGTYVTGSEYRATVRSVDLRRIFMQLPRAFQGSSHFGDDIASGSPLATDLLGREQHFLSSEVGQALIFDGPRALHRGSIVQSGNRLAMQVVFINTNDAEIKTAMGGGGVVTRFMENARRLANVAIRHRGSRSLDC